MSSSGSSLHTFYLTNALDIREILEFKSSVLETGVDNPQRYYLSSVCNQVLGTNSIVLRVPSMHSRNNTYHEFIDTIEQWDNESATLISMTIKDQYLTCNFQEEGYYFNQTSDDTTMDGFGWTMWFKLFPSVYNIRIERSVEVLCVRYEESFLA